MRAPREKPRAWSADGREPAFQMVERMREIARGLPHLAAAPVARMQRPHVGQRIGHHARVIAKTVEAQRDPVLREPRPEEFEEDEDDLENSLSLAAMAAELKKKMSASSRSGSNSTTSARGYWRR